VLVTPYMDGGDLYSLMQHQQVEEPGVVFYAAEIVLAVEYLHSINIVFRDIKPENILLDELGNIKICDFGFVKELPSGKGNGITKCRSVVGTAEYMAPEVIGGEGHGFEADWWSLGVVTFEMLCGLGKNPFSADDMNETFENIMQHTELEIPEEYNLSLNATDLIASLLQRDPCKRLGSKGAKEIKEHALFSSVDWSALAAGQVVPPAQAPAAMQPLEEDSDVTDAFSEFSSWGVGDISPDTAPPRDSRRDSCANACQNTGSGCLVQ